MTGLGFIGGVLAVLATVGGWLRLRAHRAAARERAATIAYARNRERARREAARVERERAEAEADAQEAADLALPRDEKVAAVLERARARARRAGVPK